MGDSSYNEISNNYVDAVGGQLRRTDGFRGLDHDLYITGEGSRSTTTSSAGACDGASAQVLCGDATATTVFANNVCYGGQATCAVVVSGSNIVVTGNVLISPQLALARQPTSPPSTKYRIMGSGVSRPRSPTSRQRQLHRGCLHGMESGQRWWHNEWTDRARVRAGG